MRVRNMFLATLLSISSLINLVYSQSSAQCDNTQDAIADRVYFVDAGPESHIKRPNTNDQATTIIVGSDFIKNGTLDTQNIDFNHLSLVPVNKTYGRGKMLANVMKKKIYADQLQKKTPETVIVNPSLDICNFLMWLESFERKYGDKLGPKRAEIQKIRTQLLDSYRIENIRCSYTTELPVPGQTTQYMPIPNPKISCVLPTATVEVTTHSLLLPIYSAQQAVTSLIGKSVKPPLCTVKSYITSVDTLTKTLNVTKVSTETVKTTVTATSVQTVTQTSVLVPTEKPKMLLASRDLSLKPVDPVVKMNDIQPTIDSKFAKSSENMISGSQECLNVKILPPKAIAPSLNNSVTLLRRSIGQLSSTPRSPECIITPVISMPAENNTFKPNLGNLGNSSKELNCQLGSVMDGLIVQAKALKPEYCVLQTKVGNEKPKNITIRTGKKDIIIEQPVISASIGVNEEGISNTIHNNKDSPSCIDSHVQYERPCENPNLLNLDIGCTSPSQTELIAVSTNANNVESSSKNPQFNAFPSVVDTTQPLECSPVSNLYLNNATYLSNKIIKVRSEPNERQFIKLPFKDRNSNLIQKKLIINAPQSPLNLRKAVPRMPDVQLICISRSGKSITNQSRSSINPKSMVCPLCALQNNDILVNRSSVRPVIPSKARLSQRSLLKTNLNNSNNPYKKNLIMMPSNTLCILNPGNNSQNIPLQTVVKTIRKKLRPVMQDSLTPNTVYPKPVTYEPFIDQNAIIPKVCTITTTIFDLLPPKTVDQPQNTLILTHSMFETTITPLELITTTEYPELAFLTITTDTLINQDPVTTYINQEECYKDSPTLQNRNKSEISPSVLIPKCEITLQNSDLGSFGDAPSDLTIPPENYDVAQIAEEDEFDDKFMVINGEKINECVDLRNSTDTSNLGFDSDVGMEDQSSRNSQIVENYAIIDSERRQNGLKYARGVETFNDIRIDITPENSNQIRNSSKADINIPEKEHLDALTESTYDQNNLPKDDLNDDKQMEKNDKNELRNNKNFVSDGLTPYDADLEDVIRANTRIQNHNKGSKNKRPHHTKDSTVNVPKIHKKPTANKKASQNRIFPSPEKSINHEKERVNNIHRKKDPPNIKKPHILDKIGYELPGQPVDDVIDILDTISAADNPADDTEFEDVTIVDFKNSSNASEQSETVPIVESRGKDDDLEQNKDNSTKNDKQDDSEQYQDETPFNMKKYGKRPLKTSHLNTNHNEMPELDDVNLDSNQKGTNETQTSDTPNDKGENSKIENFELDLAARDASDNKNNFKSSDIGRNDQRQSRNNIINENLHRKDSSYDTSANRFQDSNISQHPFNKSPSTNSTYPDMAASEKNLTMDKKQLITDSFPECENSGDNEVTGDISAKKGSVELNTGDRSHNADESPKLKDLQTFEDLRSLLNVNEILDSTFDDDEGLSSYDITKNTSPNFDSDRHPRDRFKHKMHSYSSSRNIQGDYKSVNSDSHNHNRLKNKQDFEQSHKTFKKLGAIEPLKHKNRAELPLGLPKEAFLSFSTVTKVYTTTPYITKFVTESPIKNIDDLDESSNHQSISKFSNNTSEEPEIEHEKSHTPRKTKNTLNFNDYASQLISKAAEDVNFWGLENEHTEKGKKVPRNQNHFEKEVTDDLIEKSDESQMTANTGEKVESNTHKVLREELPLKHKLKIQVSLRMDDNGKERKNDFSQDNQENSANNKIRVEVSTALASQESPDCDTFQKKLNTTIEANYNSEGIKEHKNLRSKHETVSILPSKMIPLDSEEIQKYANDPGYILKTVKIDDVANKYGKKAIKDGLDCELDLEVKGSSFDQIDDLQKTSTQVASECSRSSFLHKSKIQTSNISSSAQVLSTQLPAKNDGFANKAKNDAKMCIHDLLQNPSHSHQKEIELSIQSNISTADIINQRLSAPKSFSSNYVSDSSTASTTHMPLKSVSDRDFEDMTTGFSACEQNFSDLKTLSDVDPFYQNKSRGSFELYIPNENLNLYSTEISESQKDSFTVSSTTENKYILNEKSTLKKSKQNQNLLDLESNLEKYIEKIAKLQEEIRDVLNKQARDSYKNILQSGNIHKAINNDDQGIRKSSKFNKAIETLTNRKKMPIIEDEADKISENAYEHVFNTLNTTKENYRTSSASAVINNSVLNDSKEEQGNKHRTISKRDSDYSQNNNSLNNLKKRNEEFEFASAKIPDEHMESQSCLSPDISLESQKTHPDKKSVNSNATRENMHEKSDENSNKGIYKDEKAFLLENLAKDPETNDKYPQNNSFTEILTNLETIQKEKATSKTDSSMLHMHKTQLKDTKLYMNTVDGSESTQNATSFGEVEQKQSVILESGFHNFNSTESHDLMPPQSYEEKLLVLHSQLIDLQKKLQVAKNQNQNVNTNSSPVSVGSKSGKFNNASDTTHIDQYIKKHEITASSNIQQDPIINKYTVTDECSAIDTSTIGSNFSGQKDSEENNVNLSYKPTPNTLDAPIVMKNTPVDVRSLPEKFQNDEDVTDSSLSFNTDIPGHVLNEKFADYSNGNTQESSANLMLRVEHALEDLGALRDSLKNLNNRKGDSIISQQKENYHGKSLKDKQKASDAYKKHQSIIHSVEIFAGHAKNEFSFDTRQVSTEMPTLDISRKLDNIHHMSINYEPKSLLPINHFGKYNSKNENSSHLYMNKSICTENVSQSTINASEYSCTSKPSLRKMHGSSIDIINEGVAEITKNDATNSFNMNTSTVLLKNENIDEQQHKTCRNDTEIPTPNVSQKSKCFHPNDEEFPRKNIFDKIIDKGKELLNFGKTNNNQSMVVTTHTILSTELETLSVNFMSESTDHVDPKTTNASSIFPSIVYITQTSTEHYFLTQTTTVFSNSEKEDLVKNPEISQSEDTGSNGIQSDLYTLSNTTNSDKDDLSQKMLVAKSLAADVENNAHEAEFSHLDSDAGNSTQSNISSQTLTATSLSSQMIESTKSKIEEAKVHLDPESLRQTDITEVTTTFSSKDENGGSESAQKSVSLSSDTHNKDVLTISSNSTLQITSTVHSNDSAHPTTASYEIKNGDKISDDAFQNDAKTSEDDNDFQHKNDYHSTIQKSTADSSLNSSIINSTDNISLQSSAIKNNYAQDVSTTKSFSNLSNIPGYIRFEPSGSDNGSNTALASNKNNIKISSVEQGSESATISEYTIGLINDYVDATKTIERSDNSSNKPDSDKKFNISITKDDFLTSTNLHYPKDIKNVYSSSTSTSNVSTAQEGSYHETKRAFTSAISTIKSLSNFTTSVLDQNPTQQIIDEISDLPISLQKELISSLCFHNLLTELMLLTQNSSETYRLKDTIYGIDEPLEKSDTYSSLLETNYLSTIGLRVSQELTPSETHMISTDLQSRVIKTNEKQISADSTSKFTTDAHETKKKKLTKTHTVTEIIEKSITKTESITKTIPSFISMPS